MIRGSWWLVLSFVGILAASCGAFRRCVDGVTINVILLEDEESPWSLKYVEKEIREAIKEDTAINAAEAQLAPLNVLTAPVFIRKHLEERREPQLRLHTNTNPLSCLLLQGSDELGCAVLGPTCTLATFSIVDLEKGLGLSTPIMSAGSFGPSCDYTLNLQRLLPPARKISDFFIHFWKEKNTIKPEWKTAYVYKKPSNTEDCYWYMSALDADGKFATNISRTLLWKPEDVRDILSPQKNRTSNLFIMCGSPTDLLEVKNGSKSADSSEFLFVLIDLYNDVYYTNMSSLQEMKNVLVLTMPNSRKYTINSDLTDNNTMNDYMAAYHDSVLHIGQVMREIAAKNQTEIQQMDFVNVNYFRNTSFNGTAGDYKLDVHGDRDANLSVIYTTTGNEYKVLFTFDTEYNQTKLVDKAPSFIWGKRLPEYKPDTGKANTHHLHTCLLVLHDRWEKKPIAFNKKSDYFRQILTNHSSYLKETAGTDFCPQVGELSCFSVNFFLPTNKL
ncbi:heat-stable enterotoxin receptor-like [Nothobranchius furzeri]|uniref:Heat-stable enterotoxin receptor-like n=1 Tax=Nothobranchius furzeri TaxID=105023 RepID=A0A9D2XMB1_NOTFU|nr:heat-stable enterotoxin receptor-like [Nothobranchius furzeri]